MSDTSPKDQAALLYNHGPAPARVPRPGEALFACVRASDRAPFTCELRYHAEYGVEAQFLERGELSFSQTFLTRALAVQWAEEMRRYLERPR